MQIATLRLPRFLAMALLMAAALMAGGCAGLRSVDVDVNAFSTWPNGAPAGPGTSYRFDRLPSQQMMAVPADQLETITRDTLARKGLQLQPATAAYSVQVSLSSQLLPGGNGAYGYGGPSIGIGTGVFSGGGGGFSSAGIGFGIPIGGASTGDYRNEVVILIRNLQTGAVVYETRAYAQTVSGNDPLVVAAMVDSALKDYPVPPVGIRRSTVSLSQ